MQTSQRWPILGSIIVATTTLVLRLHNAMIWNPWWGYDGGAHIAYSTLLQTTGRLPTMAETYVAWHEPLFYLLTASFRTSPNFFPTLFGILTIALCAYMLWRWTHRAAAVFLFLLLTLGLPVAHVAGVFFSNEGLVHLLLLTVLLFFATIDRSRYHQRLTWIAYLCAGVLLGLALLTKLTAFLDVLSIFFWSVWRSVAMRNWRPLALCLLTCAIALLIASPWFIYKTQTYGGVFTNPYEYGRPNEQLPTHFFSSFDTHLFTAPFWPSSRTSFWSIAFASTVSDYDAILHHPDADALATETLSVGKGRVVTRMHAVYARRALFLGACLAPLFLFALIHTLRRCWRERAHPSANALLCIFIGGSLAALVTNIVRHPSVERGNLKPLFILSAILLSVFLTADAITDPTLHPRMRIALTWYAGVIGTLFAINGVLLAWV